MKTWSRMKTFRSAENRKILCSSHSFAIFEGGKGGKRIRVKSIASKRKRTRVDGGWTTKEKTVTRLETIGQVSKSGGKREACV